MHHRRMRSLLLVTALLAGCGGSEVHVGATRQTHLDPRLEDGRSSAEVLSARRAVVRAWEVDPLAPALAPWALTNAVFTPVEGWTGPVLRLEEYDQAQGRTQLELAHEAPLDAAALDLVEVDVVVRTACEARLAWRVRGASTVERLAIGVAPSD